MIYLYFDIKKNVQVYVLQVDNPYVQNGLINNFAHLVKDISYNRGNLYITLHNFINNKYTHPNIFLH